MRLVNAMKVKNFSDPVFISPHVLAYLIILKYTITGIILNTKELHMLLAMTFFFYAVVWTTLDLIVKIVKTEQTNDKVEP